MLRPEQMSKVSVTGSKGVMDDVVETVHDMHLLHVTEYDGTWDGFAPGNPGEGAEDASDKLVTVRSIESILDVSPEDAGPTQIVTDEKLDAELAEVREQVNDLNDRRDDVRSELRDVEEKLDAVEPFADLGLDLDLLSGYDSLQVVVGEGDQATVERALVDADGIDAFELFTGGRTVAVFAHPTDTADETVLQDALVGVEFTQLSIPDAEGSPEEYVQDLNHRRQQLESKLTTVQNELDELKLDAASFLLAAEEKLSIDVQKTEAPLSFATTDNAFVAEGWIPTERYTEFASQLQETVGDHVEVEELERASFGADGSEKVREEVPGGAAGGAEGGTPTAADGGSASDGDEVRADGGGVVMNDDEPPVVQDNPGWVSPFEVLVGAVGKPKYKEFDPTIILFLTFPVLFGFMIGDFGYGLVYTGIGYYLYTKFDSDALKSMGGVTIFAGVFTTIFGILYGEIFGLHLISQYLWEGALGLSHPPMEKGLSPGAVEWAQGWLVVSLLIGLLHLNVGYVFQFLEDLEFHGFKEAMQETGSWILAMNGLWVFVFSTISAGEGGVKPGFIAGPEAVFNGNPFGLGFAGFPEPVGWFGFALVLVGALLLLSGPTVEVVEIFDTLVNVVSYTRIAAVLLAKAGMAFTVNLLFFGAYVDDAGEFHFMIQHNQQYAVTNYGAEAVMFPGLVNGGIALALLGIVVLVLGHVIVLALGVTSAGLQAVRLEYVEFFGKFYDGGGKEYEPFGYERSYTTDE
ncbi:V-type ATP synthase subunit I [Salinirubrum litoreum]|uniref:A-type ATP synthase subunit I n=1 Tax=Salinirubrum litoreum TaxID=1126234 RepID=A0ABD5R5S2_9EURY|nr:V-type ATP synthase subunit I [Salinirubrum litoreum]